MSLKIADNFSYKGRKPLDARIVCSDVSDMLAIATNTIYDGIIVYVVNDKKYYTYDSSNTIDVTFQKWRELTTGGTSDIITISNKLSMRDVGKTEVLPYTDLTTNINDLQINQLVCDTDGILSKINIIDTATGDITLETIHANDGTITKVIPEPNDDGSLYFRSRLAGSQDGTWVVFDSVDGSKIELKVNSKDSSVDIGYIPKVNELVYDTSRGVLVLGDGTTKLSNLRAFYEKTITKTDLINTLGYTPEDANNKGQTNGYAPLDANGLVPTANLPASLTNTYSKSDIDSKDATTLTAATTLVNNEATTARANEAVLRTDLDNHVNNATIHVTQTDKDNWNAKVNKSDLTKYDSHITDNTIHVTQAEKDKWDGMNKAYFVTSVADLPSTGNEVGNIGYVQTSAAGVTPIACDTYIWDGTGWKQLDQQGITLQFNWGNILNKPDSSALAIDNAVNVAHNHANKNVLDKITQSASGNFMYDGVEIGVRALFLDNEKILPTTGETDTLYVVYTDSRVRGYPSISVWRDGAYQILGRGTQDSPAVVGDMSILQAEYFSVEAGKSFKIDVTPNQFIAFLPVEILKKVEGLKDQERYITKFEDPSEFNYKKQLIKIDSINNLRILVDAIPTNLDSVGDYYYSSIYIDLSDYKDITGIQ